MTHRRFHSSDTIWSIVYEGHPLVNWNVDESEVTRDVLPVSTVYKTI